MKIELVDSRRLTGPNLFWDRPGAVVDIAVEGIAAAAVIDAWSKQVKPLMQAMGWSPENICSRQFEGGASLVINAPIDVLYAACELNEAAFHRAVAALAGESLIDPKELITSLTAQVAEENCPELLALQSAAHRHRVPFLWDDDEVSIGFGKTAITWPADQLPSVESINWQNIHSVPLGIVTGTNGKSTTVRLAASILAADGICAGITSTDYIRVGEHILDRGDYSGPGGARTLLRHAQSEAVVLEVARGGLLRRGIGVERADAALITNIAADHLGEWGINTVEEMAEAKFIVRRALSTDAPLILNADDAESVRLAAGLDQQIIWFGLDATAPVLKAHLLKHGQAAYLEDGWLVLAKDGQARKIVAVNDIPITFGGAARYNISNSLGTIALCNVLGASDTALAAGLLAFSGSAEENPGRGNLFEKDGIRIFIDFAHNEHGLKAVTETVKAFKARRHMILIGQAGDRKDQEIDDYLRAALTLTPDRLLVCDMPGYERGREAWVVARRMRDFAIADGLPAEAVSLFATPVEGVRYALADAREGDCLVLLALTQRDETLAMVREFIAQ